MCCQVLQYYGIDYVVAPYEADAQLAFMVMNGYADFVISEDSDTIPYGCRQVRREGDTQAFAPPAPRAYTATGVVQAGP